MPKKDSPVSVELVKGVVESLGGQAHLDDIFKGVHRRGSLRNQIKSRYPTDQKLRGRLVIVLTQSGEFERIGGSQSAMYKIRASGCPWRKK